MPGNAVQQEYWSADHVLRRRSPEHPAVRAFALPKLDYFRHWIETSSGRSLSSLSVLDLGAGNGYFTHYLIQMSPEVVALDFSARIIAANPARLRTLGDVRRLPFRDRSFDVVLCSNLLHHIPSPERAIREMSRVARTAVVLSEPNRNNPLMFLFGLVLKAERGTLKFTRRYVEKLLREADPSLENVVVRTQGLVLPNKVPTWAVPLVVAAERLLRPHMYILGTARVGSRHPVPLPE